MIESREGEEVGGKGEGEDGGAKKEGGFFRAEAFKMSKCQEQQFLLTLLTEGRQMDRKIDRYIDSLLDR